MRIPPTPRRTGARSKPVHFTYVSTERGQPFEAYLAGPIWWGYLHMLRPSKPCVYEITGGKVACRFCATGKARVAVVKGWVPLYRRTGGDAVCVPVDEVQRDHLDAQKCFTKVTVGRERGKGTGVWVRAALNQEPVWSSSLPEYSTPADITVSLMHMWALDEVFSFFGGKSDTALSLDTEQPAPERVPDRVKDVKPAVRAYTPPDPDAAEGAFDEVFNRIKDKVGSLPPAPSANGKHRPAGKDGGE